MASSYSNGYQYSSNIESGLASEFSEMSETISTNVQKVSQNVASMQKLINQLGTPQDCENLRTQLHNVQQYTSQLVKDTNNHLKELSVISGDQQKKLIKQRLTSQFSDALKNFQDAQRTAAQKEKESVMRARVNSGLNPFDDEAASKSSNLIELSSPTTQKQMMTSLQMEEEVDLDLLREREEAVRKLESDIVDVNHIFKDLATLVHEQGEVIDSIEANVEMAQVQVSEGTQQLSKARENQAKARRKSIFLVIFLILVAGIIGLIIYLSLN